jgi:hypothetical protein
MTRAPTIVLAAAALIVVMTVNLQRSEPSEEASAIGALRAITSAQVAYREANGGYASSLKALAAACPTEVHGFVSPDLARDPVIRSGYEIVLQADPAAGPGPPDCNGIPTSTGYYAAATPIPRTRTAVRAFAVDRSGVIWSDASGIAPKPPFRQIGTTKRLGMN